jgi:uncharacterized membrane protein
MLRAAGRSTAIAGAIVAFAMAPLLLDADHRYLAWVAAHPPHSPDWTPVLAASPAIKIHLATILAAVVVTGILLTGAKGSRLHRALGWSWAVAMIATAVSTLFIKSAPVFPHLFGFGPLHVFALMTFAAVPRAVLAARRHDVARHAQIISGFVIGGLGIAGITAFLPGRILWAVFFG